LKASVASEVTTPGLSPRGRFALAELVPLPGTLASGLVRRLRERLWLVVLAPLVWYVYVFFASAGLQDWPS
jgi:hypothetical protein